jgi:hypothetical protein
VSSTRDMGSSSFSSRRLALLAVLPTASVLVGRLLHTTMLRAIVSHTIIMPKRDRKTFAVIPHCHRSAEASGMHASSSRLGTPASVALGRDQLSIPTHPHAHHGRRRYETGLHPQLGIVPVDRKSPPPRLMQTEPEPFWDGPIGRPYGFSDCEASQTTGYASDRISSKARAIAPG